MKILKICVKKFFNFVKFRKCAKKYDEIRKLFCFCFYTVQREDAHRIKPQLKVEIEDGREAP